MNHSTLPSADPHADDAVDRLLREYYQSKIPREFPALPLDAVQPSSSPLLRPTSPLSRGRWILAVCVALLLVAFGMLVNSRAPGPHLPKPAGLENSTTNNTNPMPQQVPGKPMK